MICNACNNQNAYAMKFWSGGQGCNACLGVSPAASHDVYFRQPYLDPNLPHPNRPWEKDGVWVQSKAHKKQLMAEQNLVERGDRRHGARTEFNRTLSEGERSRFGTRE